MRTSPAGRAFIGLHEGLRLTTYRCAAGVLTIGYGHTAAAGAPSPSPGMTISKGEADAILARDLVSFEAEVNNLVKVTINQHEFDALVSFVFNLGAANFSRSTLLRRLNAGDRASAAAQFPVWNKASGRVLAGLVRRRAEERAMFADSVYTGVPASVSRSASSAEVRPTIEPVVPIGGPAEPEPDAKTIARLNLRSAPISGAVLLTLPDDHPVSITTSWHYVKTLVGGNVVEGWVSGDYLSTSND